MRFRTVSVIDDLRENVFGTLWGRKRTSRVDSRENRREIRDIDIENSFNEFYN